MHKTLVKSLSHGRHLNDRTFTMLINGKADKSFFEQVQPDKRQEIFRLEEEGKDADTITEKISEFVLARFEAALNVNSNNDDESDTDESSESRASGPQAEPNDTTGQHWRGNCCHEELTLGTIDDVKNAVLLTLDKGKALVEEQLSNDEFASALRQEVAFPLYQYAQQVAHLAEQEGGQDG